MTTPDPERLLPGAEFWASWCGSCREELPALDSLARSFDPSRFAFVALSDDIFGSAARHFVAGHGFRFRTGLGDGRLKAQYHYLGLPFTVLVDGGGNLVRLRSTITCPTCGVRKEETMPTDACVHAYECSRCGALLHPRPGDCCVFCSYGSVKCPPKQQEAEASRGT